MTAISAPDFQTERQRDLIARLVDAQSIDADLAAELIEEAAWTVLSLLDERYHPAMCVTEEYAPVTHEVRLQFGPVSEVQAVERIGACVDPPAVTTLADSEWCQEGRIISVPRTGAYPYLTDWGGFAPCGDDTRLRIRYCVDSNLPPGFWRVVYSYATELAKAAQGKPCNLPERTTSVQRQGVSWTIFDDPRGFYDSGFSGIGSVDSWLAVARRNAGGIVTDPLQGHLISQTITSVESSEVASMRPGSLPLTIYQGDDFLIRAVIRSPAVPPATVGVPIDVTGWTFRAQLRTGPAETTPAFQSFVVTITDAAAGKLDISMPATITTAIDALEAVTNRPIDYRWDLEATMSTSQIVTLLAGPVTVIPEVTR